MDPTYSRDECVSAIKDFYEFLGKLYLDLSSAVMYPPDNGWPNMTSETMGSLGLDSEIISLLRHLPYPREEPFSSHPDCSLPGCRFYNWKTNVDRLMTGKTNPEEMRWDVEGEPHYFGKSIPKNFVGLLYACHGKYKPPIVFLLDIKEGLVYWMDCPKHVLETCNPQPSRLVYPLEDDLEASYLKVAAHAGKEAAEEDSDSGSEQEDQGTPPTSNDEDEQEEDEPEGDGYDGGDDDDDDDNDDSSDYMYDEIRWGPCWHIRHFFAMLKDQYMKLNFIPYNQNTVIDIDESEWPAEAPKDIPQVLQSIYHKHGWPDLERFDKEACLAELKREVAEKYPVIHTYWLYAQV